MNNSASSSRLARIAEVLAKYVPQGTEGVFAEMVEHYKFHLTITRPRNSKLGDYRAPHGRQGHRITVNGSLNCYAFAITFIHEVAHLVVWERHKDRVAPHGQEWKNAFKEVMQPFLRPQVFPTDVLKELTRHMRDPAASSVQDHALMRVLGRYDQHSHLVTVDQLSDGDIFLLNNRHFKRGERLRKRYRCTELATNRNYLVNGIAQVERIGA